MEEDMVVVVKVDMVDKAVVVVVVADTADQLQPHQQPEDMVDR